MNLNVTNNITKFKINGKEYNAKLDFLTIATLQKQLKKEGMNVKFQDIFSSIAEQDFSVLVPFIIACIKRCHPNLKTELLEDELTFDELENIFESLGQLIEASMPKEDKKK